MKRTRRGLTATGRLLATAASLRGKKVERVPAAAAFATGTKPRLIKPAQESR